MSLSKQPIKEGWGIGVEMYLVDENGKRNSLDTHEEYGYTRTDANARGTAMVEILVNVIKEEDKKRK